MSGTALRPRSISELVDACFALYRRDFVKFITIMAIVYIPWMLIRIMVAPSPGDELTGSGVLGSMIILFGGSFWFGLITATMVLAASESYLGRDADIGDLLRRSFSRYGPVIGGLLLRQLLVGIGILLLLFGSVYFYVRLVAVPQAVMIERKSATEALSRSSELTKGFRWKVLFAIGLTWGLYLVISTGAGLLLLNNQSTTLTAIAEAVVTILAYPIVALMETLVYYDLRIRKEAYDVELMTMEMESPAATAV